jgi:uncharacterized Tic20 family protein
MADNEIPQGAKPYSQDDSIFLFLAYFGILSLVPFLIYRDKRSDPQKEYVYWHARQGLAFVIAWVVIVVVATVGTMVLGFVPVLGKMIHFVTCCFWPFFSLVPLVVVIICWVKAFGGVKWEIPGVGSIAEKLG